MSTPNHFHLLLFGATGDLAQRKLFPALYRAHAHDLLHPQARITAIGRSEPDTAAFLATLQQQAQNHLADDFNSQTWQTFCQRIDYLMLDVSQAQQFDALAKFAQSSDTVIAYLSTAPRFFADICQQLARVGLNTPNVRVVLEKPLGNDLDSSRHINAAVGEYFSENQIYRIDHYLGKEALQNLLPLRFGNPLFESVWNKDFIQSVQITVAETLGVGTRGAFYDRTGALRDMVQNHLLQMLCYTAMERPASTHSDDIRNEKLKLLESLRIYTPAEVDTHAVRGQYTAAQGMNAYLDEADIAPDSRTETFVAAELYIDNPRWTGVPFYLRTGKRMAQKQAHIVINFKTDTHNPFATVANRLTISLQPDETLTLRLNTKRTGSGMQSAPADMVLDLAAAANGRRMEAYELLLLEIIAGRLGLFNRRDELEAAWRWAMPLLERWQDPSAPPPQGYPAGSWGAAAAQALLARNGDTWAENA